MKPVKLPFGGVPSKSPKQPHGCAAAGRSFFTAVAKELGLTKDQYEIRYNACGEWGETTFHTDTVYMHVNYDVPLNYDLGVLGRTCKGRKDYTGGPNQWLTVKEASFERVVAFYRQIAK